MTDLTKFIEVTDDVVDTPEEDIQQCSNKRKVLKEAIIQGKGYLLPGKTPWTSDRIDNASDKVIDKLYNRYEEQELVYKGVKTCKAMGGHIIKFYVNGVSKILVIDNIQQLRKDIEEDPIIKDSMADVGALLVTTFGKWLSPILGVCHTANHAIGVVVADCASKKKLMKMRY